MKAYNPRKNWIDELIESKAYPYPWDNARMEWMPDTNVWVLKFDIYKPNTTTMKQNTTELLYQMLGFLSCCMDTEQRNDLQKRISEKVTELEHKQPDNANLWLWKEVMKFFNQTNVTVPQELYEGVARTIKELDGVVHRAKTNCGEMESNIDHKVNRDCSVKGEWSIFEMELSKAVNYDKALLSGKLNELKKAGDCILNQAAPMLPPDEYSNLVNTLIGMYRRIAKV